MRVVVLTGAGKGFCSGADLMDPGTGKPDSMDRHIRLAALGEREQIPQLNILKPTIAAINGVVAGVGMALALCCDMRVASDRARFTIPFAKRGIVPDGGVTWMLPRAVGLAKAMELTLLGGIIDAAEADRIGLVNKVVPHDQLMDEVMDMASRIAAMPPLTMALTKRALSMGAEADLAQQLYFETYAQSVCAQTEDTKEAFAAFREKREPKFTGR